MFTGYTDQTVDVFWGIPVSYTHLSGSWQVETRLVCIRMD